MIDEGTPRSVNLVKYSNFHFLLKKSKPFQSMFLRLFIKAKIIIVIRLDKARCIYALYVLHFAS